jgi:hypothetical protein
METGKIVLASKIIYRRGQSKYEFIHTEGKSIFTKAILSKSKTQHFWERKQRKSLRNRKPRKINISIIIQHE